MRFEKMILVMLIFSLYLSISYGSEEIILQEGESKNVTINGYEYEITLVKCISETENLIVVNDVAQHVSFYTENLINNLKFYLKPVSTNETNCTVEVVVISKTYEKNQTKEEEYFNCSDECQPKRKYRCSGNVLEKGNCYKKYPYSCYKWSGYFFMDCSKYNATCSDKEWGRCAIGSKPENIAEIWPIWADVNYCVSAHGVKYPTTGEGAATWFIWNGCAKKKTYEVKPGDVLVFRIFTDASSCVFPKFKLYEISDSEISVNYVSLPSYPRFVWWYKYKVGKNTTSVKIVADGCFYLRLYKAEKDSEINLEELPFSEIVEPFVPEKPWEPTPLPPLPELPSNASAPIKKPKEETSEKQSTCNGCLLNSKCIPYGTRLTKNGVASYCDITGEFKAQKEEGSKCQNNYECLSNYCSNGKCVNIQKELEEQRSLIQSILDLIKKIFGILI